MRFDQQKFAKTGDLARGKWQEARLIEAEILSTLGGVARVRYQDRVRELPTRPGQRITFRP